jgi:hypothetical protein
MDGEQIVDVADEHMVDEVGRLVGSPCARK